jgi:hypothetical protein
MAFFHFILVLTPKAIPVEPKVKMKNKNKICKITSVNPKSTNCGKIEEIMPKIGRMMKHGEIIDPMILTKASNILNPPFEAFERVGIMSSFHPLNHLILCLKRAFREDGASSFETISG